MSWSHRHAPRAWVARCRTWPAKLMYCDRSSLSLLNGSDSTANESMGRFTSELPTYG